MLKLKEQDGGFNFAVMNQLKVLFQRYQYQHTHPGLDLLSAKVLRRYPFATIDHKQNCLLECSEGLFRAGLIQFDNGVAWSALRHSSGIRTRHQ